MPWEKKCDETDVLERATRAFRARGYEATSMANLVAATGINRGSIYAAFTGKCGLFLRVLRHYDRTGRAEVRERLPGVRAIPQIFITDGHIGGYEDLRLRLGG